jgi:hypothetical protein
MSFEERYAKAHESVFALSDTETVAFGRVLGRLIDTELQGGDGLLVQAVKARSAILCPDDALYLVGAARDLERYPGETDDAYRARVTAAFDAHEWAGTAKGIEDQLTAALLGMGAVSPVVTVLENWEGAYADGADWYSRIAIVIQCGGVWTGGTLGGTWVLGSTVLGSTATAPDVATMKRVVRKWKDAGAYPGVLRVVLDTSVDVLGIDWTLGTSALADPSSVTEWVMGPLFGSTWVLGSSPLADYQI